jgi:hypothetical protein
MVCEGQGGEVDARLKGGSKSAAHRRGESILKIARLKKFELLTPTLVEFGALGRTSGVGP